MTTKTFVLRREVEDLLAEFKMKLGELRSEHKELICAGASNNKWRQILDMESVIERVEALL